MSHYVRTLLTTMVVVAALGCGDYPRTNPVEQDLSVSITIEGPETVTRAGTVSFGFHSEPVLGGVMPVWSSQNPGVLTALGTGAGGVGVFRVGGNGRATISVSLGTHEQTKQVVVAVP